MTLAVESWRKVLSILSWTGWSSRPTGRIPPLCSALGMGCWERNAVTVTSAPDMIYLALFGVLPEVILTNFFTCFRVGVYDYIHTVHGCHGSHLLLHKRSRNALQQLFGDNSGRHHRPQAIRLAFGFCHFGGFLLPIQIGSRCGQQEELDLEFL